MKALFKPLSLALTLGVAAHSASANDDYAALKKELDIMNSVFKTALQQNTRKQPITVRQVSSTYLANQGVMFQLTTTGRHHGLLIDVDHIMSMVPDAPLPPITMVASGEDIVFDFAHEWEEFAEDAADTIKDALRESAEQLRDLKEQERDIAWEQRELEREKRELQFQLRNAKDKDELNQELTRIDKDVQKLKAQKDQLKTKADKLAQAQQQSQAERNKAKEQVYAQFFADFEANLGDTLCRFGAGLRALPDDENVTVVLRNVKSDDRDRIYVFDKKSIVQCVQTRIDVDELLTQANVYEF